MIYPTYPIVPAFVPARTRLGYGRLVGEQRSDVLNTASLMTVEDGASILRMPPRSVLRLVRMKLLPAIRLPGGQVRVEKTALVGFIEECRNGTSAAD